MISDLVLIDISFETIKLALQREDVEGLIELGAPADEYDSEAQAVIGALMAVPEVDLNPSSLAAIIAVVWAESFGHRQEAIKKRFPVFLRMANQLLVKA